MLQEYQKRKLYIYKMKLRNLSLALYRNEMHKPNSDNKQDIFK